MEGSSCEVQGTEEVDQHEIALASLRAMDSYRTKCLVLGSAVASSYPITDR